jgi:iron complex transport system substrate-binding protein
LRTHILLLVAASGIAGCSREGAARDAPPNHAIVVVDDVGDTIRLAVGARRVISLVPSATETIIALGASSKIVGRTRFDVAREVTALPSVGGTTDPSIEAIVALHPDLVIGYDSDKRRAVRARLAAIGIPVFSLRTQDTSDVFRGIRNLGALLARDSAASSLASSIRSTLDSVRRDVADLPQRDVMFVIYPEPAMTAGPGTFIAQLIGVAGGRSVFDDTRQMWPTVSIEEVVKRHPDLLILPQGEFRANAIDQFRGRNGWRDLAAVRDGHIATVPANLTQRPGANIGAAARALEAVIHPPVATK